MRSRSQTRSQVVKQPKQGLSMSLPSPSVMAAGKGTRLPLIANSPTTPGSGSIFGNLLDDSQPGHAQQQQQQMVWASSSRHVGYAVGVCSQQGKRPYQEDEYSIRQFLSKNGTEPETHFFGLFDGHAGGRCSQHLSSALATTLAEDETFVTNLPQAIKRSFHAVNENFLKIAEKMKLHDGSTGICAVIRDNKVIVANVGDCRTLIISNGRPIQMSTDHKPTNIDEQKRIASLGGSVVNCMGVARVNRVLAVSRAFGNRTLRTVIRPDAELTQRDLVDGDDFIVMASDGLWDVLKNKDVSDVCYSPYLQRKPQVIADELVQMALARGSMDNVTCIVVNLGDYRAKSNRDENNPNRPLANNNRTNSNFDLNGGDSKHDPHYDSANTTPGSTPTPKQFKKMMETVLSSSSYQGAGNEDDNNTTSAGGYRRFDNNGNTLAPATFPSVMNSNGYGVGIAEGSVSRPLTAIDAYSAPLQGSNGGNMRHNNGGNNLANPNGGFMGNSTMFRPASQGQGAPNGGAPHRATSPGTMNRGSVADSIGQQKASFPAHIKNMRGGIASEGKMDY